MPTARTRKARTSRKRVPQGFDPIDMEILWNQLIALVDEAAYAVMHTSMSKVVVEGLDFSAVLYDPDGRWLASDANVGAKKGTTSIAVKEMLKHFPAASLQPGDALVTNNPWWINGHLNDLAVITPIFHGSRLIGFAECMAHMPDIGGCVSGTPRDLYEEGFIIPPLKLIEAGRENATFASLLQANVRIAGQIKGDLHALVAGCRVMQSRALDFLKRHDMPDLRGLAAAIFAASERAMRRGIEVNIPNGVYEGKTTVDALDQTLDIKVRITSRNGAIDLDFAGSSPQVNYGINCTPVYTGSFALYTVKCIAAPRVPSNDGTFASIAVRAPEGSILNPRYPAPVRMKPATGHYIPIAILDALKDVVPRNILAESGNATLLDLSGRDVAGRSFHDVVFLCGGMAARGGKDGIHTRGFPANTASMPTEVLETAIPVRVHYKRLRADSGGAGRYRGGCGQEVALESISPAPINALANHGKLVTQPEGYRGGKPGAAGSNNLNGRRIPDKIPVVLQEGDVLRLDVPGSGGMYPPFERDPEDVRRDVKDEIVSLESAEKDYGVVLDPATLNVDAHATAERRGNGAA